MSNWFHGKHGIFGHLKQSEYDVGDYLGKIGGYIQDFIETNIEDYKDARDDRDFNVIRGDGNDNVIPGTKQDDKVFGGGGNDAIDGGKGNDVLYGDAGSQAARGDIGNDTLDGGNGDDVLVVGDGFDVLTGGKGDDVFQFKYADPMPTPPAAPSAFAAIADFDAKKDTLAFDVAGQGKDALGANFAASDGSFYSGAAAGSNGERVMVLTDQAFATAGAAAAAAQGEQAGDFIVYYNTTVGVGSLLVVSAPNAVTSIARFTDINSLETLQDTNFTSSDFVFN